MWHKIKSSFDFNSFCYVDFIPSSVYVKTCVHAQIVFILLMKYELKLHILLYRFLFHVIHRRQFSKSIFWPYIIYHMYHLQCSFQKVRGILTLPEEGRIGLQIVWLEVYCVTARNPNLKDSHFQLYIDLCLWWRWWNTTYGAELLAPWERSEDNEKHWALKTGIKFIKFKV